MNKRLATCFLLSFLAAAFFTATAGAQQPSKDKVQVMILGVYDFRNLNKGLVKTNFPDHLSEKKQQEIAEVLDLLAKFNPTKIVVEIAPERIEVQNNYNAYLKDQYTLSADETEQIGYRLAKRLGHKEVYLADHPLKMDFDSVLAAARETNNKYFLETTQKLMAKAQETQKRHEQMSVRDVLVELNEGQRQNETHDLYLQLVRVRSKEKYVGADVLTSWYQRHFRILTNLMQVIESPQDRVLVIFAQEHIPYLREGLRSNPDMRVMEPNDYLGKY